MVTPHHVSKVAPTTMPEGYKRSPEFSDRVDFDNDGDPASHDCDDHDAGRRHALTEVACDGIDQNCDGQDDCDRGQTISPAAANQPTPEPPGPKRTL